MTDCHEVNYEGMGTRVNRHPCEPIIAYPSGNSIIICSVMDPSDAYIYKGHSKSTTIAKFSPNGSWIASGDSSGFVRIWSWNDAEHLTKMAIKLFPGAVNHIDWNAESRILLVMGDDGSSQETTRSMNFDTTVHTTPSGSFLPDSRNLFLSSLSPREKLSIHVKNDTSLVQQETNGGRFTPRSTQSGSLAVTSVTKSAYFHQSDHTTQATTTSAPISTTSNHLLKSALAPSTPTLNSQYVTSKLCSPPSSSMMNESAKSSGRGHPTPRSSSNSVLDRLRHIEETMPMQNQQNSLIEGMIFDLNTRMALVDTSIASAVHNVQTKFERELEAIRRDLENRNAFQCDENVRLQQQISLLIRDNHLLKSKVDDMTVQLEDMRLLLGGSYGDN